jgi:hypothetical protein
VPLEEIKGLQNFSDCDWFFFFDNINKKKLKKDDNFYHAYLLLELYPIYYTDTLYLYMMTDHYFYRNGLGDGVLKKLYKLVCTRYMPDYFGDTEKYQRIKKEDRIYFAEITSPEDDVATMLKMLCCNNYSTHEVCGIKVTKNGIERII